MTLLLGIGVLLLVLVGCGLIWVFYPAISCRRELTNSKKGQQDQFVTISGICNESEQLYLKCTCDVSVVVPAYNEVFVFYISS